MLGPGGEHETQSRHRRGAVGAHKLLVGRLWDDGGLLIDNGVSLCAECRVGALRGDLSPTRLREDAGIESVLLPPGFEADCEYDREGRAVRKIFQKHPRHFDPT